jgi:hypothetical protein
MGFLLRLCSGLIFGQGLVRGSGSGSCMYATQLLLSQPCLIECAGGCARQGFVLASASFEQSRDKTSICVRILAPGTGAAG